MHSFLPLRNIFQEFETEKDWCGSTIKQLPENNDRETNAKSFIITATCCWAGGVPLLGKESVLPWHQNDSSNYPIHLWFALETYFDARRARNWNSLREKGNLSQMWVAEQEQKVAHFLSATTALWVAIFLHSKLGKENSWKQSFVVSTVITSDKLYRSSPLLSPLFCKGWG